MLTIKECLHMSFCNICTELGIFEENQANIMAANNIRYGDINSHNIDFIIDSRYIMVQYNIVLHTAQQHRRQNFDQTSRLRKTPISRHNGRALGVFVEGFQWDVLCQW